MTGAVIIDFLCSLVQGFSNFVNNIAGTEILGTPLIVLLLGGGLLVYVVWVITKLEKP